MKKCSKCQIEKKDSDFRERTDNRSGLKYLNNCCRDCEREYFKKYYQSTKDSDRWREYASKYRSENREKILAAKREAIKTTHGKEVKRIGNKRYLRNVIQGNQTGLRKEIAV